MISRLKEDFKIRTDHQFEYNGAKFVRYTVCQNERVLVTEIFKMFGFIASLSPFPHPEC